MDFRPVQLLAYNNNFANSNLVELRVTKNRVKLEICGKIQFFFQKIIKLENSTKEKEENKKK